VAQRWRGVRASQHAHALAELQPGFLEPHVAAAAERLRAILAASPRGGRTSKRQSASFQPERRSAPAEAFRRGAGAVLKALAPVDPPLQPQDDRETEREISPQRLGAYRGNWYVSTATATCAKRCAASGRRHPRRRLRDARAKEIPAAELGRHLGAGYGIFAGREVQWASLRFTPERRAGRGASWHPKQRSRFDHDAAICWKCLLARPRPADGA